MPQQLNEFEICISHQKFNDHAVYLGYFEDEFLLTRSQTDEHHCHFIIHRRISHMNFRSNEKNWFRCSSFFASLTSNQQRHEKNGKKHHSHPFLPPPTTYCNRLRPYQYPAGRFGSVTTLSGYFFWGVEVQLSHPNFGRGSSGISVFFWFLEDLLPVAKISLGSSWVGVLGGSWNFGRIVSGEKHGVKSSFFGPKNRSEHTLVRVKGGFQGWIWRALNTQNEGLTSRIPGA